MIKTSIIKHGKSQAILIPSSLLKKLGIDKSANQIVQLSYDDKNNAILVKNGTSRLMQKFGNQVKLPKQKEFDWGTNCGKEFSI
ncbi:hypothetical protein [Fructilactobacillus frigidiflavus]|uniref:AbrB/MazE/SpoVT family DNA-binding domain-containing protein n=1 Tax=Fructilactobacillus frigidiflavus TaxID=3242688 RepID=UPI003756C75A